jgi:heme-degrading monooxygenase HmoA
MMIFIAASLCLAKHRPHGGCSATPIYWADDFHHQHAFDAAVSGTTESSLIGATAMIVTVFRSRLMPEVGDDYEAVANRMNELAATMPGYISHKGFVAEDGERVTVVEFESEEGMRAWRTHLEHIAAQRKGRQVYYSEYSIQVCEVVRSGSFKREEATPRSAAG